MRWLKALGATVAAAALVVATSGTAEADAWASNEWGMGTYQSSGDVFSVSHLSPDPFYELTTLEWKTNYGRSGYCGPSRGRAVTCDENLAEGRYVEIRVCTLAGVSRYCGGWEASRT